MAHFVALAQGLRATFDGTSAPRNWKKIHVYDGTPLKPKANGLALVGGRPASDDIGFTIADDLNLNLRHTEAGVLGLLNNGPGSTGGGWYITLKPAPELDDRYNIIGQCRDLDVARGIRAGARVKTVRTQRGF